MQHPQLSHLGTTRSSLKVDHLLHTPDTFVRTPLPGAEGVEFIVHIAPQRGAAFTQMTAEFATGGMLAPAPSQRFIYVLEGKLDLITAKKSTFSRQAALRICLKAQNTQCAPEPMRERRSSKKPTSRPQATMKKSRKLLSAMKPM